MQCWLDSDLKIFLFHLVQCTSIIFNTKIYLTVREHPVLENFPSSGEIPYFEAGEFPQSWGNGIFSFYYFTWFIVEYKAIIILAYRYRVEDLKNIKFENI